MSPAFERRFPRPNPARTPPEPGPNRARLLGAAHRPAHSTVARTPRLKPAGRLTSAARFGATLSPGAPERLTIGRFCRFAPGTGFIASSADPATRGYTTDPFAIFNHELAELIAPAFSTRRDTAIGDDVWIGTVAMILLGVTIGDRVIVAGNPGNVARRRFSGDVCARPDRLARWDLPLDEIREILPVLALNDVSALQMRLCD